MLLESVAADRQTGIELEQWLGAHILSQEQDAERAN